MVQALNIPQMIELIEDHFQNEWGSCKILTVGGVAGTAIFKHAIYACTKFLPFEKVLVIDGCRDYIGLLRNPVYNYLYYMDLFASEMVPNIETIQHPMHHFYVKPKAGYVPVLNDRKFKKFGAMIIMNAHLIPLTYLSIITERFGGKILQIVDPYDVDGVDYWMQVPTLYDSLNKQSALIALARSLFDIETRAVDRKIKCDFKTVKMQRRTIGRIDTNQYITNDESILADVRKKQITNGFRRNQKVIVCDNHITLVKDAEEPKRHSIGPMTMLSISQVSSPLMKLRIHSSAHELYSMINYTDNDSGIFVKPANIITLNEASKHRFNSVVIVLGEEPMTRRMWYSLMKIANTISVVRYK